MEILCNEIVDSYKKAPRGIDVIYLFIVGSKVTL